MSPKPLLQMLDIRHDLGKGHSGWCPDIEDIAGCEEYLPINNPSYYSKPPYPNVHSQSEASQ